MEEVEFRYDQWVAPQNPYLRVLIHNRLKHIKEIIEGPKDPRPGGIPRPHDPRREPIESNM